MSSSLQHSNAMTLINKDINLSYKTLFFHNSRIPNEKNIIPTIMRISNDFLFGLLPSSLIVILTTLFPVSSWCHSIIESEASYIFERLFSRESAGDMLYIYSDGSYCVGRLHRRQKSYKTNSSVASSLSNYPRIHAPGVVLSHLLHRLFRMNLSLRTPQGSCNRCRVRKI